jgi:beta-xylosidase
VKYLRTGLSWADSFRPQAQRWFDYQMRTLDEFTVTLTLCFTPEHLGEAKHHTSPPRRAGDFADFAAWAVARYATPARSHAQSALSADRLKHPFKESTAPKYLNQFKA